MTATSTTGRKSGGFDSDNHRIARDRGTVTFIPEPEPEDIFCPIVSVDDHALEPLDVFAERVPTNLRDRVPQVEFDDEGVPWWVADGTRVPVIIGNGAAGRVMSEWGGTVPTKYDEFRSGVVDARARLGDMDMCGVWASLCFGSLVWGFAGSRFSAMSDQEAGLAAMRAYNDWMIEDWCGSAPDRYIPCQYAWLSDPEVAAKDIRRNAERGFRAVSFSENPEALGYPNTYSDYWDPFFQACEETETVVNLHVGSSGIAQTPSTSSALEVWVALFPVSSITAVVDWIYSRVPLRYPNIKIALSEGGASWVPMVQERLRRAYRQRAASQVWRDSDPDPVEVMRRNFFYCSIEDPVAMQHVEQIGEDNLMMETDYPHQDTTWPTVQAMVREIMGELEPRIVRKVCYENACTLYRHPEPPAHVLAASQIGALT
ncbi:MAG TPA: amidohydrolase family protein [Acidimicrobiales bacterium]|nr:amidohydrolase family protein [Acidimicrobiales bacterium]